MHYREIDEHGIKMINSNQPEISALKAALQKSTQNLDHYLLPLDLNRFPTPDELYKAENPVDRSELLIRDYTQAIRKRINSTGCCLELVIPTWANKDCVKKAIQSLLASLEKYGWVLRVCINWDTLDIKLTVRPANKSTEPN